MMRLPRTVTPKDAAGQKFAMEWNKIPAELRRLAMDHFKTEPPLEMFATPDVCLIRLANYEIRRWFSLTTATYGGYSGSVAANFLDWDGSDWVADSAAGQPLLYPRFASGYFFSGDEVEARYNETADRWYIVSAGKSLVMGRLATTLARDGTATLNEHYGTTAGGIGAATGRTATITDQGMLSSDNSPLAVNVKCDVAPVECAGGAWILKLVGFDCDQET